MSGLLPLTSCIYTWQPGQILKLHMQCKHKECLLKVYVRSNLGLDTRHNSLFPVFSGTLII
jgi:hypothetical protein